MRLSVAAFAFVAVLAAAATADDVVADKKSKSKSEKKVQEVSVEDGADEGTQTQNRMEEDEEEPNSDQPKRGRSHHSRQKHTSEGYSLFQGDMLLTYKQMAVRYGDELATSLKEKGFVFPPSSSSDEIEIDSNRSIEPLYLWPSTFRLSDDKYYIPYLFDTASFSGFTPDAATLIGRIETHLTTLADESQMFEFINHSQWQALNDAGANIPGHFVKIINDSGCWSAIGYTEDDSDDPITDPRCDCSGVSGCVTCQRLSLRYDGPDDDDEDCINEGTVIHEMQHALSFYHEQERTDRNSFVFINYTNIIDSEEHNFAYESESVSLGSPYDFFGNMHYDLYAYAIDENVRTIDPMPGVVPEPLNSNQDYIGWCDGASNADLDQMRLMYQCTTGPRNLTDALSDGWCTPDCPCWEDAPYECESNDECQGGLVCSDRGGKVLVARQEPCCEELLADEDRTVPPRSCDLPTLPQPARICQQPVPTNAPSDRPSSHPTELASSSPSSTPSSPPTPLASGSPSATPSAGPSPVPSPLASSSPSSSPTSENEQPSASPSSSPAPSASPTATASANPTTSMSPSDAPSNLPSHAPTTSPSDAPTNHPSSSPTNTPSASPSAAPSAAPTISQAPSSSPSASPSGDSDEPSSQPSAAPTSCPNGQVFIPTNYWVPPLDKPGMTCQHVRIKIPDHGEFACLPIGAGICRDNGGSMSKWRFGIEEVETPPCELSGKCPVSAEPSDTFPVLIDPALTRYPITGTTFTDSNTGDICRNGYDEAIRGCNYAGTTHVCIGEDIEANANRYSNERPYMFFYNEKTHQFLYQLVCDGIGEEGKLPQLKMVNHEALADATTVDYPIDMVKFKKGATPYTDDSNELWKMYVDWNGFEDPATRRRGKLASFLGVAHTKFCTEYVSATDRACWKEDCSNVDTPAAYERPGCVI